MDWTGIFSDVPFPGGYGWILTHPCYSIAGDSEHFWQPFPAGMRGNRRECAGIGREYFFLDSFGRVPLFSGRFCCCWWIVLIELGLFRFDSMDTGDFQTNPRRIREFL